MAKYRIVGEDEFNRHIAPPSIIGACLRAIAYESKVTIYLDDQCAEIAREVEILPRSGAPCERKLYIRTDPADDGFVGPLFV